MRNIFFLILLSVVVASNAQTYFYKLSAVVENDNRKAGNGTGLFITFIDGKCYDSDSDGCTMDYGLLNLQYKGVDKILYSGKSYWGTAKYIFSGDYELLNVIAGDCVYIYNKSSNPTQRVSTYYGAKAEDNVAQGLMPASAFAVESATVPEDEYRGKLSPEQYRQRYAEWEDKARSLYESLVDVINTSSGDEVHINKHKANESVLYQSGMRELLIRS